MNAPAHPPQIERLLELVSPRTGLIRNLERVVRGADEPTPPVLFAATVSNYDFKCVPAVERSAAGKGLSESAAIGGAIGEAVERYCASHVDPARLRRTTLADAPPGALLPQDLVLFSPRQYARPRFPFVAPTPDMAIDWTPATEFGGAAGALTWVPAVAVYLHGNHVMPGDELFMSNSSGLAAGPDVDSATLAGLCELIERDAFVTGWLNRFEPERIEVDEPGPLAGLVEHYARFGVDLQFYRLASDIDVPVVMAVATSAHAGEPAAVIGLGCHLDGRQAALRAGFEVCQVRPSQVYHRQHGARRLAREDVKGIEDHSAYFAQHEVLHELDFVRGTRRTVRQSSLPRWVAGDARAGVATCVAALRRIGCRVFAADLTTPDLQPYPIRVVRTLASALQPIHFGHAMERLGGTRLAEVARRLRPGVPAPAEADLNPCPHPLA